MSTEATGYGYVNDEEQIGSEGGLNFGLNQNVFMTKFEYIKNGGKDGAEQEAIDIIFNVGGVDKSYRRFPITKAFIKDSLTKEETTDPKHPDMKEAFNDFNAISTHIMHCFVPDEDYKRAISIPITSFEQLTKVLMALLPKDFDKKPLDLFAGYQWQLSGENNKTYLEIPKRMKYGRWLCPAQQAMIFGPDGVTQIPDPENIWLEHRKTNPQDGDSKALYYSDGAGNIHQFIRNGWFINSNFANQVKDDPQPGGYQPNPAMQPGQSGVEGATPKSGW